MQYSLIKKLKEKFENEMPGFKEFYNNLTNASKRGYLVGLDDRKIYTPMTINKWSNRSEPSHKRLNYLLQSAGAIIMKQALVNANTQCQNMKFVLNIHDEIQIECKAEYSEYCGKLLVNSIK